MLNTKSINPTSFNNTDAAYFLGLSPSTLEKSRITGQLLGVQAPPYRKAGRSVRYLKADLEAWLTSLPEYLHTADEVIRNRSGGAA